VYPPHRCPNGRHSVEVLLKIYAKVIAGQDRMWQGLMDDALKG